MKKSNEERMEEFINYHITGDGECNNVVLKAYADKHELSTTDRFDLAYFFSITYCVGSAIILLKHREKIIENPTKFGKKIKPKLIFQSDRKYVRLQDRFERLLNFYVCEIYRQEDEIIDELTEKNTIVLKKAIPYVEKWYYFGRFATFLFLETVEALLEYDFENTSIDWKNGNTATSGLMNLYGYDSSADLFDRTGKIATGLTIEKMDNMFLKLQGRIQAAGGDYLTTDVETTLCAYRKLYKGSRYNGFYLDRMLEEIYSMMSKEKALMSELLEIRSRTCNHKYLGEIGGWKGIRKEMKKYYLQTGKIN